MFGAGFGPRPSIVDLLALTQMAPGGGPVPPLPASAAAGGQTGPAPVNMGGPPVARPPVGMFAAGGANPRISAPPAPNVLPNNRPNAAPDGFSYAPPAGGDMPDVLNTGPLAPDQFALGRDMANLSDVDKIKKHKGLFAKDGVGWLILGALGDGLAAAGGQRPMFGPMMMRRRELEMEHQNQLDLYRAKVEAEREERMRPKIEQVGNQLGMLDPSAQSFQPFYSAPQPFEAYAAARGFTPGTPEYQQAVQDYRLGSYSDPAMDARTELENLRYENRDKLQDDRLAVTRSGQTTRSADTRRGQDKRSADTQRGQDLTDKRTRESAGFKGTGGKGKGGAGDLIGPVYRRGNVRMQFSKSQNKYVRLP